MKKILDIAFKDMTQSFRSYFALVFMFVVPILMTGMFYVMFGGMSSGDNEEFVLPTTTVQIVNLDRGNFPQGFGIDLPESAAQDPASASVQSLGEILVATFLSDDLKEIVDVTIAEDAAKARTAVDNQEAGVAIIIPENFTEALIDPDTSVTVEMYQDPTLTLGPSIVKSILDQFLDNFSSSKISMSVTFEQLAQLGVAIDQNLIQSVVAQFYNESEQGGQGYASYDPAAWMDVRTPQGEQVNNGMANMIGTMMAGMTVFYVFFTGASTAQTILTEDENGTLQRLFTTPTKQAYIFSGKFLAMALTIIVQITMLLIFGRLLFQIHWGDPLSIIILAIGLVFAASTFGIFLLSWTKTTRQAGFVIGGVVTLLGMVGMLPVFVASMPNPPEIVNTLSRLVPQGWGTYGLQMTMDGGGVTSVLPVFLILLGWSAAFFAIGMLRFRNRFA
jgi:ABC-2 type transport system permease protein